MKTTIKNLETISNALIKCRDKCQAEMEFDIFLLENSERVKLINDSLKSLNDAIQSLNKIR